MYAKQSWYARAIAMRALGLFGLGLIRPRRVARQSVDRELCGSVGPPGDKEGSILSKHFLGNTIQFDRIAITSFWGALLLLASPAEVQALPIAESRTSVNCVGVVDGSNIFVPGFTSASCSVLNPVLGGTWGSDADASTSGWLSGTGAPGDPLSVGRAEVFGINTGSLGGSMSAVAEVQFYFDLTAIGGGPPVAGPVQIDIEVSGGGNANGSSGQYFSRVRTNWGPNGSLTNEEDTFTVNPNPSFNVIHSIMFGDLASPDPLDWQGRIWLTATCAAGPDIGATCNAFADPIFRFADPDLANHFAFNFSPNIPINSIPEPSTLALFAAGLAGLGFMTRRRRLNA